MSLALDGIGGALRHLDLEHIYENNYEDNDGVHERLDNGKGNDDAEEDKKE